MKQLCCDRDLNACERLKARLEEHGIASAIRNAEPATLFDGKGVALERPWPEVWILQDEQFDDAWRILGARSGDADPPDPSDPSDPT